MMIKTGKHIDANGKIYLPYLHEWKHVSEGFTQCLLLLIGTQLYFCGDLSLTPSYSLSQTCMA